MDQQKLNKFAMQAGGIWRGGHVEQPNGDSVWTEQKWVDPCDMDLNKFAELIVLEMCGMMGQTEDDLYSLEPSERPTEYIEWLRSWQERFTKHFGVEECPRGL